MRLHYSHMQHVSLYRFLVYFFLGCSCVFSCQKQTDNRVVEGTEQEKKVEEKDKEPLLPYEAYLKQNQNALQGKNISEKQALFFNAITHSMPKYWIGTDWDFNGTTRTPKEGSVACGYLVTTILEDLGFSIHRIRLAQQVSSKMIKQLSAPNSVNTYSSIVKMKASILENGLENDVYIIGLDNHTGFLVREGEEIYFFHSDYLKDEVVYENIDTSKNLRTSKSFMIGSLMQNKTLFENWK